MRSITDAEIHVYPRADAQTVAPGPPPCIGAIIRLKPAVNIVVPYTVVEFDRLWTIAAASKVVSGYVAFTEPFRNGARVVSLSFSTEDVPDDE